jgi:two-component system, response regulator RegA
MFTDIILDRRVAALEAVLVPQPFKNALGGVALSLGSLAALCVVFFHCICFDSDQYQNKKYTRLEGMSDAKDRNTNLREENNPSILIVEDDVSLGRMLSRGLSKKGFSVFLASSVGEASMCLAVNSFDYAVIDFKLPDGDGLHVLSKVIANNSLCKPIIVSGHDSFSLAVFAVKSGAIGFLSKPFSATEVLNCLEGNENFIPKVTDLERLSADRVRWEYINRVFLQCGKNVSETARRLGMHRRTLQRVLSKRSPS